MLDLNRLGSQWSSRLLSILRIVAAFLFIPHGTAKFFAYPVSIGMDVKLFSLIGLAGFLEIVGGALLLLGLFTRPVAFILSGEMAFAYFIAHAPKGFWPLMNQGDAAVLYCFVFLYIAAVGGGAWSLDGSLRRK